MTATELLRIGTYLQADAAGVLPAPGNQSPIGPPWAELVDQLTSLYLADWSGQLHSIYVRGSVARGLAIVGTSDLDSFAVLQPEASIESDDVNKWAEAATQAVSQRFPFTTGVETDVVPFEQALDRSNPYAFILKTEAVCVHGDHLGGQLEPFRLSEAAFQTRWFQQHLDVFLTEYPHEPAADRPAFIAWLTKRFLRLGMELVMERENRYTRDLYLCWESFAAHYPEQSANMRRALQLAVNPVATTKVESFLQAFGSWLAAEAQARQTFD